MSPCPPLGDSLCEGRVGGGRKKIGGRFALDKEGTTMYRREKK